MGRIDVLLSLDEERKDIRRQILGKAPVGPARLAVSQAAAVQLRKNLATQLIWMSVLPLVFIPQAFGRLVPQTLGGSVLKPILVEGGKGRVLLQGGEIIHLLWHPEVRIEAANAHAAMAAVNAIAKESEYPLLVDMTATESLSRQARSVFGIRCAASRIALLGRSPVDRLLANWSLGVQNLPCPTRFFNSRTEAMKWLLKAPRETNA